MITNNLQEIITAKQNIKSALIGKGVSPTGGLSTYADAINRISTGDSGIFVVPDGMKFAGSTITQFPMVDTSNVTDMFDMFYNCTSLHTIPLLDTSNVTDMNSMFLDCTSLHTIPLLDTSNVTNMHNMFYNCHSLTTIPQLDTSNVTNVGGMFAGCTSLQSLPLLDFSKVWIMGLFFNNGESGKITTLTDLGGFKNLGNDQILSINSGFLSYAPNLTHESLMNVINNLYDRKSAGYSNANIDFGSTNLAKLSDEEKAIATNKGWTLK